MSRSQEVNKLIRQQSLGMDSDRIAGSKALARTLAAEVDELRAKLDQVRSEIGCARGQRTTQFCAEAVEYKRRLDAVVAMLEPGEKPKYCSFDIHRIYRELYKEWEWKTSAHTRAVAIAEGRDNG